MGVHAWPWKLHSGLGRSLEGLAGDGSKRRHELATTAAMAGGGWRSRTGGQWGRLFIAGACEGDDA
jgi:hypothetical protein